MAVDTETLQAASTSGPNPSNDTQLDVHPGWYEAVETILRGRRRTTSILKPSPERATRWNNF